MRLGSSQPVGSVTAPAAGAYEKAHVHVFNQIHLYGLWKML